MDDNPQPLAKKNVRGGYMVNFLTKGEKGQETGPNTNKISAYCGELAQNGENFPFDFHDLSAMPHKEEKLEEAIEELKALMEASEKEDLEENGSDNDVSILEVTSYDQLKGDKYSKIM
ncbi:hypothetical protein MKW98_001129 [Papaver atlanticum]|uniref:Uncharacterized protein n=1 Tax=Papaver atlanticum TaxID=357466 RepID=A0AAD4XK75_9MAGN|nr:hypothetical protein MKW98_001129 [Papaver atlanticum]